MTDRPMQYVFGPVPSRRLGRSLGIDTVPLKTCNWNCVYCQLGRSTPVSVERREYVPTAEVEQELASALSVARSRQVDWVTFVASGEGTLHTQIGHLVRRAKAMTDIPVAVITNGSLLRLDDVREGLTVADAVMPTLDAADPELYRRINRPHPSLTFEKHVEGLRRFARTRRHAKLWIEVMLIAGLNDTRQALSDLRELLDNIGPDEVHLTLPTRCPAEPWVSPPDHDRLLTVQSMLGPRAKLASAYGIELELRATEDIDAQIVAIVSRHPMRLVELQEAAQRASIPDIRGRLDLLHAQGSIELVRHREDTFVCLNGMTRRRQQERLT